MYVLVCALCVCMYVRYIVCMWHIWCVCVLCACGVYGVGVVSGGGVCMCVGGEWGCGLCFCVSRVGGAWRARSGQCSESGPDLALVRAVPNL